MMKMIKGRLAMYSPEASLKMRERMVRTLRFSIIWLGALGGFTMYLTWKIASGEGHDGHVAIASIAATVLVFSLWVEHSRLTDLFITPPNLHPYFDAKVPGCSLTVGVELLKQSRALDSLALEAGVKRIGEFISDDDFFDNSGPVWHLADDGVATFDVLLRRFDSHLSVEAAKNDLKAILDTLLFAQAKSIRFCLLLRDVHVTNQMEWDQRKGFC
ncbi:MAG: hypothetical protein WAW39_26145 [Prosthecobacter sp.]|uniref:hypothetical protein n=1 Tax=Prosthecobacter sp. TaxID=1965333 RepID=UPI003BAFDFC5